jgi:hypothetical protein
VQVLWWAQGQKSVEAVAGLLMPVKSAAQRLQSCHYQSLQGRLDLVLVRQSGWITPEWVWVLCSQVNHRPRIMIPGFLELEKSLESH